MPFFFLHWGGGGLKIHLYNAFKERKKGNQLTFDYMMTDSAFAGKLVGTRIEGTLVDRLTTKR